jgi:hypothetical protein
MPKYKFTGDTPKFLLGLSEGVTAHTERPEDGLPVGPGTVVAYPGDVITTDEPYPHPELELVEDPAEDPAPKRRASKHTDNPEGTAN